MGKMADADVSNQKRDNVFYDTFAEVVAFYKDTVQAMEVWEEAATITLIDTAGDVGLFEKSDIIIVYDKEQFTPSIVTERIYAKNYTPKAWRKLKRYLKQKTSIITQELGFNIRISFGNGYIDYVHYKEEWWQWALKHAKQQ